MEILENMLEDEDYKKMAELLRKGATMLNLACPACNSPLFKYKTDDVFCPVCNKKVVVVKEGEEISTNGAKASTIKSSSSDSIKKISLNEIYNRLENILIDKIKWIMRKIENEEQIKNLKSYSITILNFLHSIEKLNKMIIPKEKNSINNSFLKGKFIRNLKNWAQNLEEDEILKTIAFLKESENNE